MKKVLVFAVITGTGVMTATGRPALLHLKL